MSDSNMPAEVTTPPVLSQRLHSLDVLRGIAVLAALLVSVWIFGGFSQQKQLLLLQQSKGFDYRAYGAMELLLNGKMLSLISLVFGASLIIFLNREAVPGRAPATDVYIKRQLWLIVFGIFNAIVLLWTNDVLFHLGVIGLLIFPFFRLAPRGLLIAALFTTLAFCGKQYWNYADHQKMYRKHIAAVNLEKKFENDSIAKAQKGIKAKKDTLTKQQAGEKMAWTGFLDGRKPDLKKDEGHTKAVRDLSYSKTWNHLLPMAQSREAEWTYKIGIWDISSMIFLGMLLYKIGFFSRRFSRGRYFLVALAGITGGLLLGWYRIHFQQIGMGNYEQFIKTYAIPNDLFFPIEKASLALGYASLVMALLPAANPGRLWRALAAVGQLSLSNYILQTIVCTIFFYGYGMGYFGRLTQMQLYFFALEVIMVQVVASVIWLRYFNYGPAEWLLRRLSGGKWSNKSFRKPAGTEPLPILS